MSNLDVSLRLRLINMLGAPSQQARRDLDQLAASARKLQGTKADRLGGDLARMKTEAAGAGKEVSKLAVSARRLDSAKADRLGRDLARLRGDAAGAQQFVERLSATVSRLDGRGAERLAAGLRRAASAASSASAATERLQRATGAPRGGGHVAHSKGGGVSIIPPGMIAPIVAVEGARRVIGAGLNTSIEQEKAWAEVQKKVDGSPEQMAGLQQTLRKQARTYGMTIPEAFNQAAEAGAANIPINEIPAFIEQTMKASIGWDMDARRTAEVLAQTKAGKQISMPQMAELANKINMLGDKSAAKERDIAEMFGRAGESGAIAGFKDDDALSILTGARSIGMDPEVSARWFGALSSKLAGAATGSKKQKEGFRMLGLDPDKIAKGMETDALGTFKMFYDAVEKAPQQKKIGGLTAIAGEGWWDETARVGKALPEILRLRQLLNDPKNYQGSLDNNLAIQMATTQAHLDRMKTTVTEIGDQMFKWSLKHINREIDDFLAKFEKGETLKSAGQKLAKGEPLTEDEQKALDADKKQKAIVGVLSGNKPFAERALMEAELQDIERRLEAARQTKAEAESGRASAKGHFQSGRMDHEVEKATQALEALDAKRAEIMQKLSSADPGAAAAASMQKFTAAIESEGAKAVEASKGIAAQITDIFRMHLSPTISPRFGAPTGGGEGTRWGPGPASSPAPGKGSYTKVGSINVYGADDPQGTAAAIRKELARLGDSSNALFDTV